MARAPAVAPAMLLPVTLSSSTGGGPAVVLDGDFGVRVEVHDVTAAPPSWLAELMRALREAAA
jgi:hypothetical protein